MIGVFGEVMVELQSLDGNMFFRGVSGDTYNTSVWLSRFGHDVKFYSALGNDVLSDAILEAMAQFRIDSSAIIQYPDGKPGMFTAEKDRQGRCNVTYSKDVSSAKHCFTSPEAFETLITKAAECSAFYWSGVTLALMSEPILQMWLNFLSAQRDAGKPVFFDTNYRAALWTLNRQKVGAYQRAIFQCDYLFPSDNDLYAIFDFTSFNELRHYVEGMHNKTVILSSQKCAFYWHEQKPEKRPEKARPRSKENIKVAQASNENDKAHAKQKGEVALPFRKQVVDVTGAGDAFSGALMSQILQNKDINESISVAHECASRVVTVKGGTLPDSEWLLLADFLEINAQ